MSDDQTTPAARTMRLLRSAVVLILLGYVGYVGILTAMQRQIIFPGTRFPVDEDARPIREHSERMWLEIEGGRVEAWYYPAPTVSKDDPGPAVMLAHGNGEFIENWADGIQDYLNMGVSVLLPEYRGYGRSDGEPSQQAITEDFARFREKLESRPEVDPERIVYHGFSLGGATLSSLADERPPVAMVLQSTFTRVVDMVSLPVPEAIVRDPFDTISVVREADYPILVVHGRSDSVVPYEHGERLHEAAANSRMISHDGGHHQMVERSQYWREIDSLLGRAGVWAR